VQRISHRPSPIYHALLPTSAEGDTYLTFVSRAHVEERAKTLFPFISDIAFAPKTFGSSIILSIKPVEQSKVRNLVLFLLAFPMIKKVVVVDEDVNPYDPRDVEWSVVTRCKADRDMMVIPGLQGQPIDPTAEEGFVVTKVGINATVHGKHIDERARVCAGNPGEIERIMRSIGGAGCE
jgi:2,5-furandicarboxylate decarboxylase 1